MQFQENLKKIHFYPLQQIQAQDYEKISQQKPDIQLKVMAKQAYLIEQQRQKLISFNQERYFELQIKKQYLLVRQKQTKQIIQIYNPSSFKTFFRIVKPKFDKNKQGSGQLKNTLQKPQNVILFGFKGQPSRFVKFQINEDTQQKIGRFIQKLGKICIEQDQFLARFKATRKIFNTFRYSLIKAKDLGRQKNVVVKAYRKQKMEDQIWRECKFIVENSERVKDGILKNEGFFQSQNSIYIIFQKFDYFIQNQSRLLKQKYFNQFAHNYAKIITSTLEIIQQIVKTVQTFHSYGLSMSGIFTENNIVFKQTQKQTKPLINPYFDLFYAKNLYSHQQRLRQKIINYEDQSSMNEVLPPQHFKIQNWRYITQEEEYLQYMKKSDVFGIGNALHTILFGHSVFGRIQKDNIQNNNKNGRFVLSDRINQIENYQPLLIDLLNKTIETQPNKRIGLNEMKSKIEQILIIQYSKPQTSCQMMQIEQMDQIMKLQQKIKQRKIEAEKSQQLNFKLINKQNSNQQFNQHLQSFKKVKKNQQ